MFLKRTISLVLCFVLLLVSAFSVNTMAQDQDIDMSDIVELPPDIDIDISDTVDGYYISELEGEYKTQGRTTVKDDLLILDQSASGIEFNAECSGDVTITFITSYLLEAEYGLYFTVIVDGEVQERDVCHISKLGETTVTIAENLPSGASP